MDWDWGEMGMGVLVGAAISIPIGFLMMALSAVACLHRMARLLEDHVRALYALDGTLRRMEKRWAPQDGEGLQQGR